MVNPRAILFTKQQIGELTGLSGDTLNYWMREGVLRPAAGGAGRGSHRRFQFSEVNLAAILGQVQQFGANLASLRALADKFHAAEDWALALPIEVDPRRSAYDNPRLISMAQDNLNQYRKLGFCLWHAEAFPGRAIEDQSPLTNKPRVRLTWPEMVQFMKGPGWYQEEAGAYFSDAHFELAETLPTEVVESNHHWLRTMRGVPDTAPNTPFPTNFGRAKDGEWALAPTTKAAGRFGYSWIAIDVAQLLYDLWR